MQYYVSTIDGRGGLYHAFSGFTTDYSKLPVDVLQRSASLMEKNRSDIANKLTAVETRLRKAELDKKNAQWQYDSAKGASGDRYSAQNVQQGIKDTYDAEVKQITQEYESTVAVAIRKRDKALRDAKLRMDQRTSASNNLKTASSPMKDMNTRSAQITLDRANKEYTKAKAEYDTLTSEKQRVSTELLKIQGEIAKRMKR